MIAIIDIGSNTIRLSAYEIGAGGGFRQVRKLKSVAGLAGYGGAALPPEGIARTVQTLKSFRETIAGWGVSETHVFATAPLRGIDNAGEVIAAVKRETGFDVTVISGEEEALCGFAGAANGMAVGDDLLLIDIGGGSTELVFREGGLITEAVSIAAGSLKMYSKHVTRVIPTKRQCEKIRIDADKAFEGLKKRKIAALCGVGGVMRTLYKLNNDIFGCPPENREVSVENTRQILELVYADTKRALRHILHASPDRVHTITPGLIILRAITDKYGCESITVSESGVREGYLIRNVLRQN